MHRIDTDTASANENGVGKAGFRNGAPPGTAPTELDKDWFNSIQEEIANAVEGAGLTLAKPDPAQLLAAIRRLFQIHAAPCIFTQWSSISPATLSIAIFGLAVSPSEIVAVGSGGDIRRCDLAGLTWTSPTADGGYTGQFASVVWFPAGSLFLAAGADDEIQSSPTGFTWTNRSGTGDDFYCSAAGATFAAFAGQNGTLKTTSNGTSFSARTSAHGTTQINAMVYSPTLDRMVAVGNDGTVQRSNSSGNAWTAASDVTAIAGAHLIRVTWSEEAQMFFASSNSPLAVWKSADGLTWSAATGTLTFLEGLLISELVALPGHLAVCSLTNTKLYPYSELDGTPTASAVIEVSRLDAGGATLGIPQKFRRIPATSSSAFAGRIIGFGTDHVVASGYIG